MNKKRIVIIIGCVVLCILLAGGIIFYEGFLNNPLLKVEYIHDEIIIDIPESENRIVVKTWQYLTQDGTDIYFENAKGKRTLMARPGREVYFCIENGDAEFSYYNDRVEITYVYSKGNGSDEKSNVVVCYYKGLGQKRTE